MFSFFEIWKQFGQSWSLKSTVKTVHGDFSKRPFWLPNGIFVSVFVEDKVRSLDLTEETDLLGPLLAHCAERGLEVTDNPRVATEIPWQTNTKYVFKVFRMSFWQTYWTCHWILGVWIDFVRGARVFGDVHLIFVTSCSRLGLRATLAAEVIWPGEIGAQPLKWCVISGRFSCVGLLVSKNLFFLYFTSLHSLWSKIRLPPFLPNHRWTPKACGARFVCFEGLGWPGSAGQEDGLAAGSGEWPCERATWIRLGKSFALPQNVLKPM